MTTWFISDLHLAIEETRITAGFYDFLLLPQAGDDLYILGDFFNYWVGDDIDDKYADQIKQVLKATSERGVSLFIMHGNRDFLIGDVFCQDTGCTLLNDPTLIQLADQPALLMHGDSLCTKDIEYQDFRKLARSPAWKQDFLSKPIADRVAFAENARKQSQNYNSIKDDAMMDVVSEDVQAVLDKHSCARMIHGHTHRPSFHNWKHESKEFERIVLGDWYTHGYYLKVEGHTFDMVKFDLPKA
jgi:UDP-2,3-diacylglucosamine hydrolase